LFCSVFLGHSLGQICHYSFQILEGAIQHVLYLAKEMIRERGRGEEEKKVGGSEK
jgi:hypothetical protein